MPLDKDKMREYQRQRRAKTKGSFEVSPAAQTEYRVIPEGPSDGRAAEALKRARLARFEEQGKRIPGTKAKLDALTVEAQELGIYADRPGATTGDPAPKGEVCFRHTFKPTDSGVECRTCGWQGPKGSDIYTDGLPDWGHLIQALSTKQQQKLLDGIHEARGKRGQ